MITLRFVRALGLELEKYVTIVYGGGVSEEGRVGLDC